jgi:proline iminopeptidase
MQTVLRAEGRLAIDDAGHAVYFERHGSAAETLLVLHGGPGVSSEYLERLSELAGDGLQVVLYDQLGGGRSDRPDDPPLWTIPRFVREVEAVRSALELGCVHLFGQSWGGFLALEYALAHPEHVRTLILSNTGASGAQVVHEMMRLRMAFGPSYFDELTMECHRTLADGIPDNEFAIFGNSSHCTILEKEADLYLDVIRSFLRRRGLVRLER